MGVPTAAAPGRNAGQWATLRRGMAPRGGRTGTQVDSEVAETNAEDRAPRNSTATATTLLMPVLRSFESILISFSRTAVTPFCNSLSGSVQLSIAFLVSHFPWHFPRHFPMEVVNRNPTFGSSLLNDNFARQDDGKALDPMKLGAAQGAMVGDGRASEQAATQPPVWNADSPLLQHPDGATQKFNPVAAEGAELARDGQEAKDGRNGMRHLAGRVTSGAERTGNTDWHTGTDGGRSSKPRIGVPYGSFAGV